MQREQLNDYGRLIIIINRNEISRIITTTPSDRHVGLFFFQEVAMAVINLVVERSKFSASSSPWKVHRACGLRSFPARVVGESGSNFSTHAGMDYYFVSKELAPQARKAHFQDSYYS